MFKKYRTGELLNYLGITRDTLRYYEEKGLINPKKNSGNNYRNYDIFDIFKIMSIDFYKKRGLAINQIQKIFINNDDLYMQKLLEIKKTDLKKKIYDMQCMVKRIEETQKFNIELKSSLDTFSIKPLPLYKVVGEISEFIAIEEYENVISTMAINNNDMISQIMRYISFNKRKVVSTKILIVDEIEMRKDNDILLQYPKCLYTVREEIQKYNDQEDLIKKMYQESTEYANNQGINLLGEAFARIRLITYNKNNTKTYIEIFIPFE